MRQIRITPLKSDLRIMDEIRSDNRPIHIERMDKHTYRIGFGNLSLTISNPARRGPGIELRENRIELSHPDRH